MTADNSTDQMYLIRMCFKKSLEHRSGRPCTKQTAEGVTSKLMHVGITYSCAAVNTTTPSRTIQIASSRAIQIASYQCAQNPKRAHTSNRLTTSTGFRSALLARLCDGGGGAIGSTHTTLVGLKPSFSCSTF